MCRTLMMRSQVGITLLALVKHDMFGTGTETGACHRPIPVQKGKGLGEAGGGDKRIPACTGQNFASQKRGTEAL